MFRPTPPLPVVRDVSGDDAAPAAGPDVSRQRLWASIISAASVPFGVLALLQVWAHVQPLVPMPWLWCLLLAVTGWVWDRDLDVVDVGSRRGKRRSRGRV